MDGDYSYRYGLEPAIQKQNQYIRMQDGVQNSQPFENRNIHRWNSFGPFIQTSPHGSQLVNKDCGYKPLISREAVILTK